VLSCAVGVQGEEAAVQAPRGEEDLSEEVQERIRSLQGMIKGIEAAVEEAGEKQAAEGRGEAAAADEEPADTEAAVLFVDSGEWAPALVAGCRLSRWLAAQQLPSTWRVQRHESRACIGCDSISRL
jgi:hypothetical protein